jgi:hypothetical protein
MGMALLGEAAIAMWWEMDPSMRREFEHWHSHEHFPERLSIPGFLRGSRWAQTDGGNGFFIMYELDRYATLSSPDYLERLNKPTPWSTKLMPYHANMVRSQCRVLESRGGATARYALTLQLSPSREKESELRAYLKTFFDKTVWQAGITAAHLLHTQTPAIAQTKEQEIRGGNDQSADWIVVVTGYEVDTLNTLLKTDLSEHALVQVGVTGTLVSGLYSLSYTALASDVQDIARLRPEKVSLN